MKFLKNTKLITYILLAFHSIVFSQQEHTKGQVINASKEYLPFATIHLLNEKKDSIVASTYTDELGKFELLKNSKANYIYARYLEQISDTLKITSDKPLILLIKNGGLVALEEVSITSRKTTIVAKSDRFVYAPSKLMKETAGNALDLVKTAPLLAVDHQNNTFSIINKKNTRITINGRRTNLPKEMIISILNSTPAKNIKSIEIITNPGSEFTADTTGGVININLTKNLDDGLLGFLSLTNEQAHLNTAILNGSINYRRNKLGIRISPFINNSFNFNTSASTIEKIDQKIEQIDQFYRRRYLVLGGGFGIDYDFNKNNILSINGFFSKVNGNSRQEISTAYSKKGNAVIDSVYKAPVNSKDTYTYNFGNIYYKMALDSMQKNKLTFNIDYNQFKKDITNNGKFQKSFPSNNTPIQEYRNSFPQEFFNISASIDYYNKISSNSTLRLGSQISTTNFDNKLSYQNLSNNQATINSSLSGNYKYKENYFALYANNTQNIQKKLNLSYGLRMEVTDYSSENVTSGQKIDSSYVNFFPNLSISYDLKKNKTLSLSLARKISRPSIESLLPGRTYINPTYFEENNPFLLPVIYYNIDAMYALNYKYYFSGGFSYRENQFEKFVIPFLEDKVLNQKSTYINYGNSTKTYFQFYTRQQWFNQYWIVNFSSSFNLLVFEDETGNIFNKKVTNFNYDFFLNNTVYLSKKGKFSTFMITRYASPIEDVSYKRTNPLFKMDIGLRKSFKNWNISLFLNDVLNTYNLRNTEYRSNLIQNLNQIESNQYTQSISLSLNYSFGNNKVKKIRNKTIANDAIKKRI